MGSLKFRINSDIFLAKESDEFSCRHIPINQLVIFIYVTAVLFLQGFPNATKSVVVLLTIRLQHVMNFIDPHPQDKQRRLGRCTLGILQDPHTFPRKNAKTH